jgi:hypothetical protein
MSEIRRNSSWMRKTMADEEEGFGKEEEEEYQGGTEEEDVGEE